MSSAAEILGASSNAIESRDGFLRWQCRVRQIMMRREQGRPTEAATPAVTLPGAAAPIGHIVTVLSKRPAYSLTPELRHIAQRTQDPAQRREKAVQLFSETYFQKAREFSDVVTATMAPNSTGAARLLDAQRCVLTFDAFGRRFDLDCAVSALSPSDPHHQATWWHNYLFNPNLPAEAIVLAFRPDWAASRVEPTQ